MSDAGFTREEARARFDAAVDGELDEQDRIRFEAALSSDASLRAEYESHRSVVEAASRLNQAVPPVDLLASVQHKLRARSGGKFYRDRFAERAGTGTSMLLIVAISALFVVAAVCLVGYQHGWFAEPRPSLMERP